MVQNPQDFEMDIERLRMDMLRLRGGVKHTRGQITDSMKYEESALKDSAKDMKTLRDSAKNFEDDLEEFKLLTPTQKESRFSVEQIKLTLISERLAEEKQPLLHMHLEGMEQLVQNLANIIQRKDAILESIINLRINSYAKEMQH